MIDCDEDDNMIENHIYIYIDKERERMYLGIRFSCRHILLMMAELLRVKLFY